MGGVRGSNTPPPPPPLWSTPDIIYLYIYTLIFLFWHLIQYFFLLFPTSRIFLWSKLHKSYYDSLFFNDQIFATVIFRCDMLLLLAPLGLTLLLVGCLWQYFLFLFSFLHPPPPFFILLSWIIFLGSCQIVTLNSYDYTCFVSWLNISFPTIFIRMYVIGRTWLS